MSDSKDKFSDIVLAKSDDVYTTSLIIAKEFGKQHKNVLRDIESLQCSKEFRRLNFELSSYINSQGKKQKMYIIKRDGFMFLVMGYTGDRASELKEKFIYAFNYMYEELSKIHNKQDQKWIESRQSGIEDRKLLTDKVDQFIKYALEQGASSGAKYYYSNITKAIYKTLGIKYEKKDNFRDTLKIRELIRVSVFEESTAKKILEGIEEGKEYKDIYQDIKRNLEILHDLIIIDEKHREIK